jgi:hypothetical protein
MTYDDLLLTILDEACKRLHVAPKEKAVPTQMAEEVLS